jgi:hypothetical protein
MGEGKPASTPINMETHEGDAASSYGANTNLDPQLQGGPASASDRAATDEIEKQHQEQGTPASQSGPSRS